MAKKAQEAKINELLTRGVEAVYPSLEKFRQVLQSGRRLIVYLGIDPTAFSLHIGHVIQLQKLRQFQQLGHQVILLIGDFTGMIGDPTDKTAARVRLTRDQVRANARDYVNQASAILDFQDPENPALVKYNSEWLAKLTFEDVVELAAEVTVQQMLQRSMFQERLKKEKPIWLHEFLYPLMQGYDSVAMKVDVEIGGSDQIFNMLVGSDLVRRHLHKQKYVVANRLLTNPQGEKWGKTSGHTDIVWLKDSPLEMFQKIMLWPDAMAPLGFELCTYRPMAEVKALEEQYHDNPLGLKEELAFEIVKELKGERAAREARESYHQPEKAAVPLLTVKRNEAGDLPHLLAKIGLAKSVKAARRLLAQGGVKVDGQVAQDIALPTKDTFLVQVGKKITQRRRVNLKG